MPKLQKQIDAYNFLLKNGLYDQSLKEEWIRKRDKLIARRNKT